MIIERPSTPKEGKEKRTEKLVRQPAKRVARHKRHDSGDQPPREPPDPVPSPYHADRIAHTRDSAELCVARRAPRLQDRFSHVQWRRRRRRPRPCEPARE